jgi:asparagine synthase (glutamine-hydrolysing)
VSGFVGDLVAGGSYLRPSAPPEREVMSTRCRRFTSVGIRARLPFFEMRLPFTDNDVMDYAFGLPRELRANAYLYHRMLLRFFPRYYRAIPWQTTGVPINWPARVARLSRRVMRRTDLAARSIERHTPLRIPFRRQFVDYAAWLRREPARSMAGSLLLDSRRRSSAFAISPDPVELWRRHQAGENHAPMLGRHLTFEIWMRQLFDGELRPRDPS